VARGSPVRVLADRDVPAALELLARDPIANVFVQSRVESSGLDPWRLGAEMWGYLDDNGLSALCYAGANLVPVAADDAAVNAFADRARRHGRRCSSIVGPQEMVGPLWHKLERVWGGARDVRPNQPLMATRKPPTVAADPGVRRVTVAEVDILLPASISMFTEEVGVSPIAADGGTLYRARVHELVGIDGDRVTLRVDKDRSAAVAGRLLAEHGVTDLTIEDPPVEDVIEQVFSSGALPR
jgi:predicted GNAT family acetyltransferase